MRIDVNDPARRRRGRITVDPTQRQHRVPLEDGEGEVFLSWDGTLDDAGHLRKCVCCGCPNLYRMRTLPSVTPIIVILAFAGAAVSLLGYATNQLVYATLILVLVIEVTIVLVAKVRLVCYRCRSQYSDIPIAPYHERFERENAEAAANQPDPVLPESEESTPGGPDDDP
ncbi:MAG: hypothetical protein MK082_02035 [Phycisphaerales bacterium]|nr:hypothetical protein [Phycisphaerales bacterium]